MKAVLRDFHSTAILLVLTLLLCAGSAIAQTSSGTAPSPPRPIPRGSVKGNNDDPPLTTLEEEMHAKRAIKAAEKDHQENLSRAREIEDIGKQLHDGLKNKSSIDREFIKKIERLEKLTKKVRGEAGGEDQEVTIANRPADITSTVSQIAEASETLSKDVQNTPRQVVSASVIGNANVLLELIRMLRAFANLK